MTIVQQGPGENGGGVKRRSGDVGETLSLVMKAGQAWIRSLALNRAYFPGMGVGLRVTGTEPVPGFSDGNG
jgi:pyruvate/2-oxoglutarate/acetoin dehydrogenase E1 component